MVETEVQKERVILVGVSEQDGDDTKDSLEELKELVATAGAVTEGMVIQNRERIHPGTYVGTGKSVGDQRDARHDRGDRNRVR